MAEPAFEFGFSGDSAWSLSTGHNFPGLLTKFSCARGSWFRWKNLRQFLLRSISMSTAKPSSTHLGLRIPFSAVFNFRHSPARFHSNLAMFSKSTLERCICLLVCIRLGCSKASKIYVYIFEPRPSSSPSPKALVTFYQWPEYDRLIPRLHSTVTPSWNRRHE